MRSSRLAALVGLLALQESANALHFPLVSRSPPSLARRGNLLGDTGPLNDKMDTGYTTIIALNGANYTVAIDTGSSDLWVSGVPVPNAVGTSKTTSIVYSTGTATGTISTAGLEFAGYGVSDQAFLFATGDTPGPGVLGLGPYLNSNIYKTLTTNTSDPQGLPPLDNIFKGNNSVPNFFTLQLGRVLDPNNNFPGDLTIMELVTGLEDVVLQPRINVLPAPNDDQRWTILIDSKGIHDPLGHSVVVNTTVVGSSNDSTQLVAAIDTGFVFSQVPPIVAQTIYQNFTGAALETVTGVGLVWTLPCTAAVNVTFKFGDRLIPVHTLDATMPAKDLGIAGRTDCIGTFQPMTPGSISADVDVFLGMNFLRNVYTLVNFGNDFSADNSILNGEHNNYDPYVQFFSLTNNTALMQQEFAVARLGANNTFTTASTSHSSTSTFTTPTTSASAAAALTPQQLQAAAAQHKKVAIIAGSSAGAVALILVAAIWACCRRSKEESTGGSYALVEDPKLVASIDVPDAPMYAPRASTVYRPPSMLSTSSRPGSQIYLNRPQSQLSVGQSRTSLQTHSRTPSEQFASQSSRTPSQYQDPYDAPYDPYQERS